MITWASQESRHIPYRFCPEIQRKTRELNRLDNWHGLCAWLEDLFWIALPIWLCYEVSFYFYPAALVLIGARMRALATLLHESAHGILADSRLLNLFLGTVLSAYPIFQRHYPYKKSHVATHHPKLGNPEVDPDLMYFIEQGVYAPGATDRQRWLRLVIFPALGLRTWSFVRYLIINRLGGGQTMKEERQDLRVKARRDQIAFLFFWGIVLAMFICTHLLTVFFFFWIIPLLGTFQIFSWYIELAEHTPLVRDYNVSLYMTRNRKSRGLERFLTSMHAENYHLDHHLDPRTPFWNIKKVHQIRLMDPEYARWDARAGGLFHKGPQGQDAAIVAIVRGLGECNSRTPAAFGAPVGTGEEAAAI
jgi:fatty acid desaturase